MADLQLSILTPAKVVTKVAAQQLQAPGVLGYLGILPGHARLISELGVGEVRVQSSGGTEVYFVAGGYLDVADDKVTLLVDVAERPGDIDVRRAEEARQRALNRLETKAVIDVIRAQAALVRAEQRLMVATRRGS